MPDTGLEFCTQLSRVVPIQLGLSVLLLEAFQGFYGSFDMSPYIEL